MAEKLKLKIFSTFILLLVVIVQFSIFTPLFAHASFTCDSKGGIQVESESDCPGDYTSGNNYGQYTNGLVPCTGTDCDFNSFLTLIGNVINYTIFIAVPIAAVAFSYAGFLYLTAVGDTGKIEEAHGIFKSVLTGVFIMLAAWLLVNAILTGLGVPTIFYSAFLKQ